MPDDKPDFEGAAVLLEKAREAYEAGNQTDFEAYRYLLGLHLGLKNGSKVHTRHLQADAG